VGCYGAGARPAGGRARGLAPERSMDGRASGASSWIAAGPTSRLVHVVGGRAEHGSDGGDPRAHRSSTHAWSTGPVERLVAGDYRCRSEVRTRRQACNGQARRHEVSHGTRRQGPTPSSRVSVATVGSLEGPGPAQDRGGARTESYQGSPCDRSWSSGVGSGRTSVPSAGSAGSSAMVDAASASTTPRAQASSAPLNSMTMARISVPSV
jgi:hypothetical protein